MRLKGWEKMQNRKKNFFFIKTTGKNKLTTFTENQWQSPLGIPAQNHRLEPRPYHFRLLLPSERRRIRRAY